jgi:LPXTG-site transpeptidase (sortase) family protein
MRKALTMKKKQFYPVLLLVVAAALYVVWYGNTLENEDGLQTVSAEVTLPTLPGLPDGEPIESNVETNLPSANTGFVEPPLTETEVPAVSTKASFSLGAPATVATPPAWANDGLPHDKLFITTERQRYKDKQLTLIIPKLNQVRPVLDGTELAVLNRGVGLLDYSQLPGEGNRNVSIAGHRNGRFGGRITDKAPFYYIDTLTTGDRLYLRDEQYVYEYVYKTTFIVEPDDWAPIYSQGFSCLTLVSCEPIGVNTHRIIVQSALVAMHPVKADEEFTYQP